MNTYQVRLQGIARTRSVMAKDQYEAAEVWARTMPLLTWIQGTAVVEVQDIDGHVSTFAVDAVYTFTARMMPA
jgi:hypothetical protein